MSEIGVHAIVVAAGASRRMAGTDKLAADLAGRPVLAWSLTALAESPSVARIVVVTSPGRVAGLRRASWLPAKVSDIVTGGDRRHESVAAGLRAIAAHQETDEAIVLVHDGARPMITPELVERVVRATREFGAAVPVVPVVETLKRVDGDRVLETLDRSGLVAAQTPQGARIADLRRAFERYPPSGPETWTDEAALLEACRIDVRAIPGDPTNLKVTVPADLARADTLLARRAALLRPLPRIGLGRDTHPFGPGEPLQLGGVSIAGAPRLVGHSDGDVALHAVADALLGAAGLGDLGRMFPAGPATPSGISSARLLQAVVGRVAEAGLRPVGLDLTIVAARPRLGAHLALMQAVLTELLAVPDGAVNVKASSGNLTGPEGAGRAISAVALATLDIGTAEGPTGTIP